MMLPGSPPSRVAVPKALVSSDDCAGSEAQPSYPGMTHAVLRAAPSLFRLNEEARGGENGVCRVRGDSGRIPHTSHESATQGEIDCFLELAQIEVVAPTRDLAISDLKDSENGQRVALSSGECS